MRRILVYATGRTSIRRSAFTCLLTASIFLLLVAKQSRYDFTNNQSAYRYLPDEFIIENIENGLATVRNSYVGDCGADKLRAIDVLFLICRLTSVFL
jgi:hypothetical protein